MGICAYCGRDVESISADHVVPQAIWGGRGSLPCHMVTVPACLKCHGAIDVDVEYFRNVLTVIIDQGANKVVDRILDAKVTKSINRNSKAAGDLFRNIRAIEQRNDQGLIIDTRLGFDLDVPRFNRPLEKIVRGLFYKKSHMPLPVTYGVKVFPGNGFWSAPGFQEWLSKWESPAGCGDDQFLMRCTRDQADHNMTAWLLQFYGEVAFLAWTEPLAPSSLHANKLDRT